MRLLFGLGLALAISAIALILPALGQTSGSYYCEPLRGYYPQVPSCPVPWHTSDPAPTAPLPKAPPLVPYYAPDPYDINHSNSKG